MDVNAERVLAQRRHLARLADDDGEDAGPALGLGEAAALPGPLGPFHLEGLVRGAHHARHLDGDAALAHRLERVVDAGERGGRVPSDTQCECVCVLFD